MPANAIIDQVAGLDTAAVKLVPYLPLDIGQNYKAGPFWTCDRITHAIGESPSTAICRIPLATGIDEAAPSVAAVVNSPAPAVGLTGHVRAINESGSYNVVFRGYVTKVGHEFDSGMDYATFTLSDARWLLQGVPLVGSYWSDGSFFARYRVGEPLWPNRYGEPNAIFSEAAGVFVMCEPRRGLDVDDTPPDPHEFSTSQACYWEPWMVLAHARYIYTNVSRDTYPEAGVLPSGIIWPDGLHESLDTEDNVRARDESLMGKNAAALIQDLADQVGGFGLSISFEDEERPTIALVRTRYTKADDDNGPGVYISRATGISGLEDQKVAVAGSITEDADQLFTRLTVAGAPVMVERRCSTAAGSGLIPAWADADKTALSGFIDARLASGVELYDAIKLGFRKYPDVFSAYKIDPTFDFTDGILPLVGKALAQVARPILGTMITSYLSDATTDQKLQFRRPILWEYLPDGGSTWRHCTMGDLSIDAMGIIRISTIRDTPDKNGDFQTFAVTQAAAGTSISKLTGNSIRASIAIPHDYRLTATVRHPSDYNNDVVPVEEFDADRVAGITGRHAYLAASKDAERGEGDGSFRQEWRNNSWPIPETAQDGTVTASGDTVNPYTNDEDIILSSAKRRAQKLMRLKRGGTVTIPRLTTTLALGQQVNGIDYDGGRWPLRAMITSIVWNNQPGSQYTILGFGN